MGLLEARDLTSPETPVYDSARRPNAFFEEIIELVRGRDLVLQWSVRNIKLRYKRSILGVLWTLLEPLMMMTILAVVFSNAFRFPIENFPVYLLPGLLLFTFFSRATLQIVDEIVIAGGLANRIYMAKSTFAVAAVVTHLVNWLFSLIPLVLIMLFFGHRFAWALVTVPVGILLTAMFALGVGLLVATLGAFFHDFHLTYQVLVMAWLYATPIIYPVEIVPAKFLPLMELNPLLHLCSIFRDPIFEGRVASVDSWLFGAVASLATLALGWWVFTRWRSALDYRV